MPPDLRARDRPQVREEQFVHTIHDEVHRRMVVARRWTATDEVVVFELRDHLGVELPAWSPGAHIDVILPGDIVRQYSLCGDPGDRTAWQIGVLREPESRGGSRYIHESLRDGTEVDVLGPRNNFELVPSPRYVFVAGGIGVTPILPMVATADKNGADWELHYGGRSRSSMAFLDVLGITEDAGDDPRVTLYPQDEVGLIDLDRVLETVGPDTKVYCCGPEPLLKAVEEWIQSAGWPSGSLHVERFAAKEQGAPVWSESFEVELRFSGMTVTVTPEQSILDAVEDAGVFVLSSCKEGTCGTCETPVLEGEVDHRDSLLTRKERAANETMYICVSRAACPRLVLDL